MYLQLIQRLDTSRFRSTSALLGPGWLRDSVIALGLAPLSTESHRSVDIPYLRQLIRLVRSHRIDIIQTHLLTTAVYGSVAGRLCGVPVVSTFHGLRDVSARYLKVKSAAIGFGASCVVFVSNALRDQIVARTGLPGSKNITIHNGVDTERFTPRRDSSFRRELGVGENETLVGAVGRMIHAKGFDVLLHAAALLRGHPGRFRFVLIGEKLPGNDTDEQLRRLGDSLGISDSVHILPFRQDIERVYNSLDIFALSSRTEGFSLTTVEALASGVPAVVTRSGGPEEIVTPDHDALLIPTEDSHGLATALAEIAERRELATRLSRAGRATAVRRFGLDVTIDRYMSLYRSLLTRER